MSRAPSTTIEGGTAGTALGALWVGFFAVLALVAILLAVSSGFNPVVRVVCLAVAAGLAFLGWQSFRRMFAPEGRLRINVADDAIEFQLQGHRSEVFTRAEIGLITINEGGFNGVVSLSVFGPDESLLGSWETKWIVKPPQQVKRVLERHGYPVALTSAMYGSRRFYSRRGRARGGDR